MRRMKRTGTDTGTGTKARRKGRLRGIQCLYSAGLVALLVAAGQTLAPWIAGPDEDLAEIDARWAELEAIAAPQIDGAEASLLFPALDELRSSSLERTPLTADTRLDPPAHRAVEHLVEWKLQGGGIGEGLCADMNLRGIAVHRLGLLALHEAEGVDDPRFTAAVQLGLQLRDRGGIIKALMGQALLLRALESVRERGWELPEVLVRERPTHAHLRSILARDAVCSPIHWASAIEEGHVDPAHLADTPLEKAIAAVAFDQEREILYLRSVVGERMLKALATGAPAQNYSKFIPPREARVPSLLVRETESYRGALGHPERAFAKYNEELLRHVDLPALP